MQTIYIVLEAYYNNDNSVSWEIRKAFTNKRHAEQYIQEYDPSCIVSQQQDNTLETIYYDSSELDWQVWKIVQIDAF